jgi:hypothetical protein
MEETVLILPPPSLSAPSSAPNPSTPRAASSPTKPTPSRELTEEAELDAAESAETAAPVEQQAGEAAGVGASA